MSSESSDISSTPHGVTRLATSRPRVLGWLRSAAILDGDWGTSVAYVMGIGFALAGYSSFWHLSAMMALTSLVAINYITICRLYPNGGGVYSSVYHRSKLLAVVGALLLAADYIVTMALSVLDACHYFGLENPVLWAIVVILAIGALNWFGPKHSGGLALLITAFTLVTLFVVIVASAPTAIASARIDAPQGGLMHNWGIFTGFILSLSGIEAISNMTGLMKDPTRDSRKAILAILVKVLIVNAFLGLAMLAIQGLKPGDYLEDMIRFLAEHYVGKWFGLVIASSLGVLLISAGNTALNDLISIQFLMSVDKELPSSLRILNRHGVPIVPLAVATLVPIIVLLVIGNIEMLSHLYAIGLVGAMTINLGSTATDKSIKLKSLVRGFMMVSATVLLLIEVSIAINKTQAVIFASSILVVGLGARTLARRRYREIPTVPEVAEVSAPRPMRKPRKIPSTRYLLAMKELNEKLLRFAIEEAESRNAFLFVLRVKEIAVGALPAQLEMPTNGQEQKIEQICYDAGIDYRSVRIPSYDVGYTIAEQAATFGVERVIIGAEQRSRLEYALKGSVMRSLSNLLPEDVQLVIFGG
ncbi:MAG: universal stress protein [Ignavibacteriales bacterium]|nr:universal stress protein [Ignavibacteriales bacterium]